MKLEYLSDSSINFALIRLYDYEQREVQILRTIAAELANGVRMRINGISLCLLRLAAPASEVSSPNFCSFEATLGTPPPWL